jgi:hypothetical protein
MKTVQYLNRLEIISAMTLWILVKISYKALGPCFFSSFIGFRVIITVCRRTEHDYTQKKQNFFYVFKELKAIENLILHVYIFYFFNQIKFEWNKYILILNYIQTEEFYRRFFVYWRTIGRHKPNCLS